MYRSTIGFPGQFFTFVILFDEGVIQIREINLGHEIRSSNLYFGHSICTLVKKLSVYIIEIKIRDESIQIRHRSGQRLNWMTVLRTSAFFGNLNNTSLDLNGVNANSNTGKIKSNVESVMHDQNLLNWMLLKWIWSGKTYIIGLYAWLLWTCQYDIQIQQF